MKVKAESAANKKTSQLNESKRVKPILYELNWQQKPTQGISIALNHIYFDPLWFIKAMNTWSHCFKIH